MLLCYALHPYSRIHPSPLAQFPRATQLLRERRHHPPCKGWQSLITSTFPPWQLLTMKEGTLRKGLPLSYFIFIFFLTSAKNKALHLLLCSWVSNLWCQLGANPQARESRVRHAWGRTAVLMWCNTHTSLQHQQRHPQLLIAGQNSTVHQQAASLDCIQHAGIEIEVKIISLDFFLWKYMARDFYLLFFMISHKEVATNPEG